MDMGQGLIALDKEAQERGAFRFNMSHDFIHNGDARVPDFDYDAAAATVMAQDPEAWSSVARASLLVVQGSQNDRDLAANLEHLGVIVVAWLRDVKARTAVGIEP